MERQRLILAVGSAAVGIVALRTALVSRHAGVVLAALPFVLALVSAVLKTGTA